MPRNMETETGDPNQPVQPLTHWCVRRVLENGEEIKYMMTNEARMTKRVQQSPPQLHATRLIGREVWKAEALLTEGGEAIGYVKRGRQVSLGLAMGTVKDEDSVIE